MFNKWTSTFIVTLFFFICTFAPSYVFAGNVLGVNKPVKTTEIPHQQIEAEAAPDLNNLLTHEESDVVNDNLNVDNGDNVDNYDETDPILLSILLSIFK